MIETTVTIVLETSHVVMPRAVMNHVAKSHVVTSLRAQKSHARMYRESQALKPLQAASRSRRAKEPYALRAIGHGVVARVVAGVAGAVEAVEAVEGAVVMAIAN
jgi:hypothetical protein